MAAIRCEFHESSSRTTTLGISYDWPITLGITKTGRLTNNTWYILWLATVPTVLSRMVVHIHINSYISVDWRLSKERLSLKHESNERNAGYQPKDGNRLSRTSSTLASNAAQLLLGLVTPVEVSFVLRELQKTMTSSDILDSLLSLAVGETKGKSFGRASQTPRSFEKLANHSFLISWCLSLACNSGSDVIVIVWLSLSFYEGYSGPIPSPKHHLSSVLKSLLLI